MKGSDFRMWDRTKQYTKRKGLDGPFWFPNGQVLYFDRKEKAYWDPTTDFFLTDQEVNDLKAQVFALVAK